MNIIHAPRLVVKETRVEKPRFPVIDCHNHFLMDSFGGGWDKKPLSNLLEYPGRNWDERVLGPGWRMG